MSSDLLSFRNLHTCSHFPAVTRPTLPPLHLQLVPPSASHYLYQSTSTALCRVVKLQCASCLALYSVFYWPVVPETYPDGCQISLAGLPFLVCPYLLHHPVNPCISMLCIKPLNYINFCRRHLHLGVFYFAFPGPCNLAKTWMQETFIC